MSHGYKVVGHSVPRADAVDKVTGRATFLTDLVLPGMLWAKVLRSPHAHARIAAIRAEAARAVPGVVTVLTGSDLTDCRPVFGPAFKDQPIVARERVRFEGEPVVAVAAEDEATAAAALDLIEVEYEPLPAVTDIDAALAPDAPVLHPEARPSGHFKDLGDLEMFRRHNNLCHSAQVGWGDIAQGMAQADRVFTHTFSFPAVSHVAMEPYVSVALWEHGRLTVYSSTQHPHPVRNELAEVFDLDMDAVRVVVPVIGGAYGNKCYTKYEPLAAALARKAGRPVRVAEDGFHTLSRHAARVTITTGVDRQGRIVARDTEAWLDTGAYSDIGPRVANKAAYRGIGPYRIPHARARAHAVFTNKVPAGAFRGYGAPQMVWAVESQMDIIAQELGLDPLEFRLRNLVDKGERWNPKDNPIDGDFRQGLTAVAQALDWPNPRAGLAISVKDGGGKHTIAQALVRVHHDGTATVQVASIEIGQGMLTVMAQIAAEALGLPYEAVRVRVPDTDVAPWDQGTSASRATTVVGMAVWQAADSCRRQLEEGGYRGEGGQEAVRRAMRRLFGMPGGEIIGQGTVRPGFFGEGSTVYWEAGMGAAEIDVDPETGEIRLRRYLSAADVGLAINPALTEGQDEGAAMMGIGHTFREELAFRDGQLVNGNLIDYRVPTFSDLPGEFGTILIENQDGPGPYHCKGVGESGIIPVAPAVANALARLTGVRLTELPLTPERVWRALRQGGQAPAVQTAGAARSGPGGA